MRAPSDTDSAFAWWRSALAWTKKPRGNRPAITTEPQCGFYRRRLVKGGPWVPARVWIDQKLDGDGELTADERMRCWVDNAERNPVDEWLYICDQPITEPEFRFMCATATWAEENAPNEPAANPTKKVDWLTVPLPSYSRGRKK